MSSEHTPTEKTTSSPDTESVEVVETVIVPLRTSERKRERVSTAIDEFQEMCSYMADILPSFSEPEWNLTNTSLYRVLTREFPTEDREVGSKVALAAQRHVTAAFSQHAQTGDGELPSFGERSYFRISNQNIDIVENDSGFGCEVRFIPGEPEWFHISPRPYTRKYLSRIVDGDATYGAGEFHLSDSGDLALHLPVKWDVEMDVADDIEKTMGVDIGIRNLYSTAVVENGDVKDVSIKSGDEFAHHRHRLREKRAKLSEKGDLNAVKQMRGEEERYTEQVLDTCSKRIVELAAEHAPVVIRLEDLSEYRENNSYVIHDWPFAVLQTKIGNKARAAGIPVEIVSAEDTSTTCRKCGDTNESYRRKDEFSCDNCGYEVHSDVNAAINIAQQDTVEETLNN